MSDRSELFYAPRRFVLSVFFGCLWLSLLLAVDDVTVELVAMICINASLTVGSIWYLCVLSISSSGLVLHRVNKMSWSEVVGAKHYKIFGLKCIRIKRKKGMSWSLPLYYVGQEEVTEALMRNVPEGNPLFVVSREARNT